MYPEESQSPQPIHESLMSKEEHNHTNEQSQNSSVDSVVDVAAHNSTDDIEAQQGNLTSAVPNIDSETPSPTEESTDKVGQLEEKSTAVRLETELEAKHTRYDSQEAQVAERVAELQRTEQALKEEIANSQASYKTLQAQV